VKIKDFISKLDENRIVAAIASAEMKTSGEIRVSISPRTPSDILDEAEADFKRAGMHQTKERNGVLLLVTPKVRKFALYGDVGIHHKCGEAFWNRLRDQVLEHFKRENFTPAIVDAVATIGEELAKHFPRGPDDRNELSNKIVSD